MSDEDKKATENADETPATPEGGEGESPETPAEPVAPVEPAEPVESKSAAKRKASQKASKKDAEATASTDGEETSVKEAKPEGFVTIRSADGRQLEASIGDKVWKGVEISVPEEQAGDVRMLLEQGGFFLKD